MLGLGHGYFSRLSYRKECPDLAPNSIADPAQMNTRSIPTLASTMIALKYSKNGLDVVAAASLGLRHRQGNKHLLQECKTRPDKK